MTQTVLGSIVSLWRYLVKSMLGEERRFLRPSRTSALDPLLRHASRTARSQGHARNQHRRLIKLSEQQFSEQDVFGPDPADHL